VAADGDVFDFDGGLAGGVPRAGDGAHLAAPVEPEHDLVGVFLAPDVVGAVVAAVGGDGDGKAAFHGLERMKWAADFPAGVGVGFHALGGRMIGVDAPAGVRVGPDLLRAGADAPDVVADEVAAKGVFISQAGGRPARGGLGRIGGGGRTCCGRGRVLATGGEREEGDEKQGAFHSRVKGAERISESGAWPARRTLRGWLNVSGWRSASRCGECGGDDERGHAWLHRQIAGFVFAAGRRGGIAWTRRHYPRPAIPSKRHARPTTVGFTVSD